jgi:hypothetical protein
MPSPSRSWNPRKPTPCEGVRTPDAKGLLLVRSTCGEICHQIKECSIQKKIMDHLTLCLCLFQWKVQGIIRTQKKERNRITLLSMSRSRRSFTVQPAPLRRMAPHPKSASILKSGNCPGIAAMVIDLRGKGLSLSFNTEDRTYYTCYGFNNVQESNTCTADYFF